MKVTLPVGLIQFEGGSGPRQGLEMKRSSFTEEQIIGTLKEQGAEVPVADLCGKREQRQQL